MSFFRLRPSADALPPRRPAWAVPTALAAALGLLALSGCGSSGGLSDEPVRNEKPTFVKGALKETVYDGTTDGLLAAGMTLAELSAGAPKPYANPAAPTAAELRRNAIHANYRALVDATANGGWGRLYGPNVAPDGSVKASGFDVAGTEVIAVADDGSGRDNVVLMVQVPSTFDVAKPCIVTGTSSGSRGIYGAIGTSGDWGLKHHCAVAYTDKGTGNGVHDLATDSTLLIDGTRVAHSAAVAASAIEHFRADLSDANRTAFNAAYPNRVAYKHAHSQRNPEKDWGLHTLQAVQLAFYVLNEKYGAAAPNGGKLTTLRPSNTVVIASSVSNGAGAALAAAELDTAGWIDGVAVTEPQVQPGNVGSLEIRQGSRPVPVHSRPLADYFTYANIYQPCAALADSTGAVAGTAPVYFPAAFAAGAANRCTALKQRGLLTATTTAAQAEEALAKLQAYGWLADSNYLHLSHARLATNSIAVTYVNTYGRFSVADRVCGFSFAATTATGDVAPQNPLVQGALFATGNGVPPTSGVNIVYDASVGGPKLDFLGVSPTSGLADWSLDGVLCLRSLVTGVDEVTGQALTGDAAAQSARVRSGIAEVQRSGQTRGKSVLIVAGRSDALIPVNHAARPYFAKTRMVDGYSNRVSYVEVLNAQHFDSFVGIAGLGYETRYVPLHVYFNRAMDTMYAHLTTGAALPPPQVLRPTLRATAATPLEASQLPAWSATPPNADRFDVAGNLLVMPD